MRSPLLYLVFSRQFVHLPFYAGHKHPAIHQPHSNTGSHMGHHVYGVVLPAVPPLSLQDGEGGKAVLTPSPPHSNSQVGGWEKKSIWSALDDIMVGHNMTLLTILSPKRKPNGFMPLAPARWNPLLGFVSLFCLPKKQCHYHLAM